MFAIHMAIEIAETILFLFQMAILSKVHERPDLGGFIVLSKRTYIRRTINSEEAAKPE
jgi:hypothetical protein